jgi:undecaprenyl-diphosphatase
MDSVVIFCAKYLIFMIAVTVFVFWLTLARPKKIRFAASIVLAVILAGILAKLAGKLYYHPRPFIAEGIKPLIEHGNDNSFPSEHSLAAAAIATTVYFFDRRLGMFLLITAVIVGLGRIFAHVHYPIDVLAGLLLGALAAWSGYKLAGKLLQKKQPTVKPAAKV